MVCKKGRYFSRSLQANGMRYVSCKNLYSWDNKAPFEADFHLQALLQYKLFDLLNRKWMSWNMIMQQIASNCYLHFAKLEKHAEKDVRFMVIHAKLFMQRISSTDWF